MVRTYKPKTDRSKIDEENIKSAISEVTSRVLSIRKAADKYGIKPATLQHRVEKFRKAYEENQPPSSGSYTSKYSVAQVFTVQEEKALTEYLLTCSKMHYGLSLKQLLTLAYEFAEHSGCKYPESWKKKKCAGKDWAAGFRNRNQELSLRKPENTSTARSFAFNKTAVGEFFENYERVMMRYKFTPDRIINLDETGINTVLPTPKVLAEKTQRQVGQIVSAERGELVTFCGIVTATGTALAPVYVFPRVHFKEQFLNGAPEGSLGLANRSGWMTSDLYVQVLQHVQRQSLCSKDNPILIICDNHESHISIEAVNYCRDNGIIYLSLPPHTSHKLQPLDVSVFGPFKGKLKVAFNDWHIRNVGKTLSIYNIAELSKYAFLESFTPKNITSGFSKPGIWPFNKLAFGDDDFAPIEIYSQSFQDEEMNQEIQSQEIDFMEVERDQNNEDVDETCDREETQNDPLDNQRDSGRSANVCVIPSLHVSPRPKAGTSGLQTTTLSPASIRPYPKKDFVEKKSKKGREKGKSRVYTDTPEKNRLQTLHDEKEKKREEKLRKQKAKELKTAKNLLGLTETKKPRKKKVCPRLPESDSSETELLKLSNNDDYEESDVESGPEFDIPNPENINVGDFLLIKFEKKRSVLHYVAKVISKYNLTDYEVLYLRKKSARSYIFVFPDVEDKASVDFRDVVLHLPTPNFTKGTTRTSSMYSFSINLSAYNVQ